MTDVSQIQFPGQVAALGVLAEVVSARHAHDAEWGAREYPDGTGPQIRLLDNRPRSSRHIADIFRGRCEGAAEHGQLTWRLLLLEGVFATVAEADAGRLRRALVRLAAVAVAWIEAIDRRTAR